jgi:NNP family nitrate/nitrite transporter-like MFS transporter
MNNELKGGHRIDDWRPEDEKFWANGGKQTATRNLWISIPNLLLAFSVWVLWSVVVVRMPDAGFHFNKAQLSWLTAKRCFKWWRLIYGRLSKSRNQR